MGLDMRCLLLGTIIFLLITLPQLLWGQTHTDGEWTSTDMALLFTAMLMIHRDVESTRDFLREGREETNPFLGEHPSPIELTLGELVAMGLTWWIAGSVNNPVRKVFLGGLAGNEWYSGMRNERRSGNPDYDRGGSEWTWPPHWNRLRSIAFGILTGFALHKLEPLMENTVFVPDPGNPSLIMQWRF